MKVRMCVLTVSVHATWVTNSVLGAEYQLIRVRLSSLRVLRRSLGCGVAHSGCGVGH